MFGYPDETLSLMFDSGALAAPKWSPILIQERKGNPWVDFLMLVMASGIARGHVRTTTTATESHKMAAILQKIVWQRHAALVYGVYGIILWSIDTCQIKLSADQYHVTISQAQVHDSLRSRVLLKLTSDQVLVFDWIASSWQVNLLKTEPGSNVNQIITVSSLKCFCLQLCFVYRFCDY